MTTEVFLVEGDTDERFLNDVVIPEMDSSNISTVPYSEDPDPEVNKLIDAFQGMYRELYLLRDFDYGKQGHTSISGRKDFVQTKFSNIDKNQIIVVMDSIEGWYLAGIDSNSASELEIRNYPNTEYVGKDIFKRELKRSKFNSEVNFQKEIAKQYSIETARLKNSSFNYFMSSIDY